MSALRNIAVKGLLWSAFGKFSSQILQFIISIILARLLLPKDFGLLGMLSIFIAISNVFIDSGLSTGLIQKQERSDEDFSTVFLFNLFLSILLYIILWFSSPLIAHFFKQPQLIILTRIVTLSIIIDALSIVQRTKLTILMDFKSIANINIVSSLISGMISIFVAFLGFGIWALVANGFVYSIISFVFLIKVTKWRPNLQFSKSSFKYLFSYGSKILFTGILNRTIQNIYNIVIGKAFNPADLGFFTKAKNFADLSSTSMNQVLQQVTFPILATLQKDKEQLIVVYRRMLCLAAFIIFPLMALIAILAEPIIILMLTEKWRPVIPILQWYAFSRLFYPIGAVNMNVLNATGRSDLFFKVELFKLPILIITLAITISLGIKAIVIGSVVASIGYFFIDSFYLGKYFHFGAFKQLRAIFPIVFSTFIVSIISLIFSYVISSYFLQLVIIPISAICIYMIVCKMLKIHEIIILKEILTYLKRRVRFKSVSQ